MSHLHVTHITEGIQIVKYRAPPLIRHRNNKSRETVTYTKHIRVHTPTHTHTLDMYSTCLYKMHLAKICGRNLRLLPSKSIRPNTEGTKTYT